MTQKALQIGINYVGTSSELKGCINDVINMKNFLIKEGYKPENMRLLTEATHDPNILPTADNIVKGIKWLLEGATGTSKLFFNYSGHGGSIRDTNNDETDKKDETICPLDYEEKGQITDDLLRELLIDPLPAGCQLICLMDCCHSGTVMDLKYNWVGSNKIPGAYKMMVTRSKPTNIKVITIAGCKDEQYSADTYEAGQSQGAMTYAFLKTIGVNRKKTFKHLIEDMDRCLKQAGYDQVPQLSGGRRLDFEHVIDKF